MDKILSILIPSYNMEAYLPKCLNSVVVAPEWMEKLEVLVVNDGSKDRTGEIAHDYEAKYPGVFRVIDKTNGNYGSCINAALPQAKGFYVKVLDADDWFETANFTGYLQFLAKEVAKGAEAADLVLNDFDFVLEDGVVYEIWRCDAPEGEMGRLARFHSQGGPRMCMHAVALKAEMLRKMGYRQTEGVSYTDQEWIFYPFSIVKKTVSFPKIVYHYLNGRKGQTCNPNTYIRNIPQQIPIVKRMLAFYEKKKDGLNADNEAYLRQNLIFRLQIIYNTYLFKGATLLPIQDLRNLDQVVKEADREGQIYSAMEEMTIARRIKVPLVRKWRAHPNRRPLGSYLWKWLYDFRVRFLPKKFGMVS